MESPCKGCEREKLDKNKCIDYCTKIRDFQKSLGKEVCFYGETIFHSSETLGIIRKTPKPPCL